MNCGVCSLTPVMEMMTVVVVIRGGEAASVACTNILYFCEDS